MTDIDHLGAFSAEEEAAKIQAVERAGQADTPIVDGVINSCIAAHPHIGRHGLATYFEAVHQELAPVARRLERDNAALREALLAAKIPHSYCEDSWYSCPLAEDGCSDDRKGQGCECGAEAHNASIDKALAAPGKGVV